MYTLCFFVAVVCGQVTKGPENVAVLVGNNVTLRCAGTVLSWMDYTSDKSGLLISTEATIYFKTDKYELITDPTGTYDLIVKSLELKQGGRYRCKGLVATKSIAYAEVVTFSGETLLLFHPCCMVVYI